MEMLKANSGEKKRRKVKKEREERRKERKRISCVLLNVEGEEGRGRGKTGEREKKQRK